MESDRWFLSGEWRKQAAAETCVQQTAQRKQAGCEYPDCKNTTDRLEWHHQNETNWSESANKRTGVKRQIPWFKPTDNPEALAYWLAELQRCVVLCSSCHRLVHQQHQEALKALEQAAMQAQQAHDRRVLENSLLVAPGGVKRTLKELRNLETRLD